jgi:HPt (histidine-containing phosphotransfer) domain-containing protein
MTLDELLKNLQIEYLSELPSRIEVIKSHVESKDVRALVEDFHKLKGTGKTYGIPEISVIGEKMEMLLIKSPEVGLVCVNEALKDLIEIQQSHAA